jgi:hypothetical protein
MPEASVADDRARRVGQRGAADIESRVQHERLVVERHADQAGIKVPDETLEQGARDEEARKARAKAAQPAPPKNPEAKPAGNGD